MKRLLIMSLFVVCACQPHWIVKPPPVTIEPAIAPTVSLMPTVTPTPEN